MIKTNHKFILEIISTSPLIRKRLSFREHLKMYNYFSNLSEKSIDEDFSNIKVPYKDPSKKTDWWIRVGLMSAIFVTPIPGLTEIVLTIKNAQNYKCRYECLKNIKTVKKDQQLCYRECEYASVKFCVDFLERELKKCRYSKKPLKCRTKIFKLLKIWKVKLVKSELDLDFKQRIHAAKLSKQFKLKENETPTKTNPKLQKIVNTGLAISSLTIPIPGLSLAIKKISDINIYKCRSRCEKSTNIVNKNLCYSKCKYEATKWSVAFIERELSKCNGTKKPIKCKKKLFKMLMVYRKKLAKEEIMHSYKERKARSQGKI